MIRRTNLIFILLYQFIFFTTLSRINFIPILNFISNYNYSIPFITILIQIILSQIIIWIFDFCYKCRWLDRYKTNKNHTWLFLENPQKYQEKISQTYYKYYFYIGPMFLIFVFLSNPILSLLDTSIEIPTFLTIYLQANLSLIIGDFFFYICHLILHQSIFYKYHKEHHGYTNLTIHSRLESSIVDYLAETICYGLTGILFFKMHVLTYFLLIITGMAIDILDHSGYEFPVSPLNELIFEKSVHHHHDNHHSKIMGNYASISLIYDWIFGTTLKE